MTTKSRHHLYTSISHEDAYSELNRLDSLYKSTFKKGLQVELFFSSWGVRPNTLYGITAYYDKDKAEQLVQLEFLKGSVNESAFVS